LIWGLAQAEHNLGKSLTKRPIVIHAGEPQVFERTLAQHGQQLGMSGRGVDVAARDGRDESLKLCGSHRVRGRSVSVCRIVPLGRERSTARNDFSGS